MTGRTKSGSARLRFASLTAAAATIAVPGAAMLLTIGATTPAFAGEPTSLVASAVPFTSAVSASALLGDELPSTMDAQRGYLTIASGMASYYGRELAGNRTASGERFNPAHLTAAHRTLPLGSKVRVTNPKTGSSVIVRINDRGPFHSSRLIDLSEAAARQIGIRATGSGKVDLAVQAD